MKKLFLCFLVGFVSVISLHAQDSAYKELSVQRYNIVADEYPANERICFTKVNLWSNFDENCVRVDGANGSCFFASMSNEALNWLLDYSEKDPRWSLRYLNIYGITLEKKEGSTINKRFRIEKIELR